MAGVTRFEDLKAWQRARELAREVYGAAKAGTFSQDFALKDQIRRAVVSVMANIAEGFERGGNREFHHFLVMAKGSCAEVRSDLYLALDTGHLPEGDFERLQAIAVELSKVLGKLRAAVDRRN